MQIAYLEWRSRGDNKLQKMGGGGNFLIVQDLLMFTDKSLVCQETAKVRKVQLLLLLFVALFKVSA